ncbi:pilus assembly protein TadG-related protein [Desulfofundulus sp.]|uniref:pilus assembly protein TadG-related protein n=1 Tax=Desulfofundulus sp. TaxID=2282750 RepID=UPI003C70AC47
MLRKLLSLLAENEKGSAVVLVSLMMLCLLGFAALVTDFGLYCLSRQQLVNAVDAAALAGAGELSPGGSGDETAARSCAEQYALKNVADLTGLAVSVFTTPSGLKVVQVNAVKKVDFILARLLGYTSGEVQAAASAAVAGITSCRGVAPLLIARQDFKFGERYTLKYGDPASPGNFGALSLGGTGADIYRHNLIYGYSGRVSVGDMVTTEPGNMSGPTQAIDERLARCTDNCTVDHYEPGCPKILIIPVYDPHQVLKGRSQVRIEGFAAFLVDRVDCAKDEIQGYFISTTVEGDADFSRPPDTGVYAVRLLQ